MGKKNSDTNVICPKAQNDRKKSIIDKENSVETKISNSKSISKVRKEVSPEVLEDENSSESNSSSNSKSSTASSSTSKDDGQENSLKSNKKVANKSEETAEEKSTSPQFRVASNNPTGFKLRIVPLEKLLEKPPAETPKTPAASAERTSRIKKENLSAEKSRRLPQRKSKPISLIELSESEEDEDIIISSSEESDSRKKTRKPEASKTKPIKKSTKKNQSDSEEDNSSRQNTSKSRTTRRSLGSEKEQTKKSTLRKVSTVSLDSDSEDESVKITNKKKPAKKSSDSESEENNKKAKKSSPSGKDQSKNNTLNKKAVVVTSDSESEDDVTKSNNKKKPAKKPSESESEDEATKSKNKKKPAKESSESESEGEATKTKNKKKPAKESSESESEDEATKSKNKKKPIKKSAESESEEEATKSKNKKKPSKKSSASEAEDESTESKNKKKPSKKSSNSESEDEATKSKNKKKPLKKSSESEEDNSSDSGDPLKTTNKKKSAKQSTDSELEENIISDSVEDEPIKTANNKKPGKKSSDSGISETKQSKAKSLDNASDSETEQKSPNLKKTAKKTSLESEADESVKSTSKGKQDKKSEDSVKEDAAKERASSKRKLAELSSNTDEDLSTKGRVKRKPTRQVSTTSKSSESSADKSILAKSKQNKKGSNTPPSPSAVRRFVVRIKRSKLSDFKDLGKKRSKGKMNGGTRSEKPSTSSGRRRRVTSEDDDSDFNYKRGNIDERLADHDYDRQNAGSDDDDNNNDDSDSQNSTDSEVIPTRKRRVFKKDKESSDSDFEVKKTEKKKKRRVRRASSGDSDDDDDEKKKKRKTIRKIMKNDDLNLTTKEAAKEEEERRKRIEERQKIYNQIYVKPESTEVGDLVLDFDEETTKTLLEVDKGLMKKLKPHQVTGVKFMWDACFETLKDAQEKNGSGCILAHCMGLGKTMQIVTLSHTLICNSKKTGVERVLIISPLSTLNNWAREFKHWISFTRKRNIEIYDMSKYKDKATRIFKLNEWFEEGGVCILGYDMYRILANEKAKGLRKKQREQLQQSLVDPGPDMVVCDEGHLLKNEKTSISKAVTRMRTLRRIVLTGTPLQNNLKEYYCMIQFIKPNLLGTYKEYLNRFVNPISNGQYTDSTERDIRLMKHRSHILHKLLEGCIQRRDYSVLAPYLPPKHEYVVYTTLSTLQQLLYEYYMTHQRDLSMSNSEAKGAKLFKDFQELRRIWTHPMNMRINSDSVIRKKVLADQNDSMDDFIADEDDDQDEPSSTDSSGGSSKSFGSGGAAKKIAKTRTFRRNAAEAGIEIDSDIEEVAPPPQDDPSEWWKRFVADKELNNINHSPKLVMLMRLLEQCEAIGDKLLVFSQSLQSLDTIEHFLALIDSKSRSYEYEGDVGDFTGFWTPGTDYFRLDGSCSVESRESMCKQFNDVSNVRSRLFLISTRAGGLGINLVSANRVVIFDVSWNPSHDTQSIFRVYRFGQEKPCYIYRLIAMGTMEQKLYERQVAKQATAKRVIDEQQISRHYNQSDLQELYTYELEPGTPREIPILPKDRLFAELLSEHEKLLFKYHEHDSLLENDQSENLSESERKAAWSEYEAEKTRTVQTAQYMAYDRSAYGQFGNSAGSVTSNKIFGFRSDVLLQLLNMKIAKDHPEMNQNQVIQVVPTYLNQLYSQMNGGDPSMYKELLTLHATLIHPSGMYMNPLLYVNQNPQTAGYFQAGAAQPGNGVVGGVPMMAGTAPGVVAGGPMMGVGAPVVPAPGFDPNEVYEID